jgi:N-methylhydantoinase A/oxoprolinase/acetone carboxylase beta subunit
MRAFAPGLGPLISSLARRPWPDLLADPVELARMALQAREVAGATHLVVPLDPAALAAACGSGATVVDDAIDLSAASFGAIDDLEPERVLASPWLAPMLEVARSAGRGAGVPIAARLPSPRTLAAAVGADPDDPEAVLAAADLCSATALELLRAGASLVLVDPRRGASGDESVALLERTARPFEVAVFDTSSAAVTVLELPLPAAGPGSHGGEGDRIIVTDRPVRGEDDLGRLREVGMALAATSTGAAAITSAGAGSGPTPQPRGRSSRSSASTERFAVGIDMGGTFTDAYVTSGERSAATKVPTLRFDLTRSLVASLRSAADALDLEVGAFMRRVAILKVATTIGTNAVIEGTGTRVGVVVAAGHEADLYGPERPRALFEGFVAPDDVIGIDPAATGDKILDACRRLVANGVRQVVVALPRSADTHADERRIRAIIRERYPEHYLRSVPLQLSTDVTASGEDAVRAATAVVNAYLHRDMAHLLGRAEQELRAVGLDVPVLVVHASSGVARVATSVAIGTYSAGPSAGLSGAEHVAHQLHDRLVLTADMGGTTLDLGLVVDGRCEVELRPSIAGVRVALPMNRTSSFGIGGGSLVGVAGGAIRVGPESAGAVPGPAAFGRGGRLATVTDVDLVAGLLADGAVLGGEVTLSGAAARAAIEEIAGQLGVAAETAAARIETAIDAQIGAAMRGFLAEREVAPEDVTLYAFGGAGPLHFAPAASLAGIRRMRTFAYGGVFSAFGCTAVDVRHRYELLIAGDGLAREHACSAVEGLVRRAGWDLSAEGFAARPGTCRLVIEGADGRELAATARLDFGPGAATQLVDAAWPFPDGGATLAVIVDVPTGELRGAAARRPASAAERDAPPAGAEGGPKAIPSRTVWWAERPVEARMVSISDLPAETSTPGPVLLVDGETVSAVPPGWTVRLEPDDSLLWERR